MKILISAPSGYNTRELLLPLKTLLENERDIEKIFVLSPAAEQAEFWKGFSEKFEFVKNPRGQDAHDELIGTLQPNAVITNTNGLDTYDVAILRAAKNKGIPTLTFIASWDNVYKMERAKKKGRDFENADYFAVWNVMMREHLLRVFSDIEESAVEITGAPRFDYFQHENRIPTKEELMRYLGFENVEGGLIHCATTELYPFEYIIKDIAEARDNGVLDEKYNLYASVHPGGDMKKHEGYMKYGVKVMYSFGRRERTSRRSEARPKAAPNGAGRREQSPIKEFSYMPAEEEIYMLVALFKHTDILVNQSSTVAIESMRANVPVINVKYGMRMDWWRWYRSMVYRDFNEHYRQITSEGGTSVVKNERELIAEIKRYEGDAGYKKEERAKTIKKMITYTDGSAGGRVLSAIKRIA